jgi:predicted negative regulator of RcsB-dependent stress response
MAKHPTARRVHREQNEEDVFVSGVLETGLWAKHHQRILTTTLLVLAVLVAGFAYMRHFNAQAEEKASMELTGLRQEVLQGNQPLAIRDLTAFVKKYGSTPSSEEARLLLAQEYMQTGQAPKAITAIEPVAKNPAKGEGASAALLLAAAYEASNQPAKALDAYKSIAAKARFGFEKREALDRAAALEINRGNNAAAAELYEQSLNTLPKDNEERQVYEMRIAEAKAAGAKSGS